MGNDLSNDALLVMLSVVLVIMNHSVGDRSGFHRAGETLVLFLLCFALDWIAMALTLPKLLDVLAAVLGLVAYIGGGVGLVAAAARLVGHRGRPGGGRAVQF